jgi:hypothetical protein
MFYLGISINVAFVFTTLYKCLQMLIYQYLCQCKAVGRKDEHKCVLMCIDIYRELSDNFFQRGLTLEGINVGEREGKYHR